VAVFIFWSKSNDRSTKYRRLFRVLGLSAGIEGYNEKVIIGFHSLTHGLSVKGAGKGYTYGQKN
jgi:hypothetical protein